MTALVSIALFVVLGFAMVLAGLLAGRILRPHLPHPQKEATYECGETTIGDSWVQFDLRFYIVALFYLVFDVEVALLYPWAVVFRGVPTEAFWLGLPFIAIVVLGFAYEWRTGSLDWVRSAMAGGIRSTPANLAAAGMHGEASAPGSRPNLAGLARIDPEILEERQPA